MNFVKKNSNFDENRLKSARECIKGSHISHYNSFVGNATSDNLMILYLRHFRYPEVVRKYEFCQKNQ